MKNAFHILPRSSRQYNRPGGCEAEILRLNGTEQILATSVFSLSSELQQGIFREPYLIGWMMLVPCTNRMLAAGARPEFATIHYLCRKELSSDPVYTDLLYNGLKDAARLCHLELPQLEIREAATPSFVTQLLGKPFSNTWVGKDSCLPGDILYSTGLMGSGNLYAYQQFTGCRQKHPFRPTPRFAFAPLIRSFATSCLSTRFGFFRSLAELATLNSCSVLLEVAPENLLPEEVRTCAQKKPFYAEFFLAAPYGEHELLFTVSPEREKEMLQTARSQTLELVRLGKVSHGGSIGYKSGKKEKRLDPAKLLHSGMAELGDPEMHLQTLQSLFNHTS